MYCLPSGWSADPACIEGQPGICELVASTYWRTPFCCKTFRSSRSCVSSPLSCRSRLSSSLNSRFSPSKSFLNLRTSFSISLNRQPSGLEAGGYATGGCISGLEGTPGSSNLTSFGPPPCKCWVETAPARRLRSCEESNGTGRCSGYCGYNGGFRKLPDMSCRRLFQLEGFDMANAI
jgi:hypothetical protein